MFIQIKFDIVAKIFEFLFNQFHRVSITFFLNDISNLFDLFNKIVFERYCVKITFFRYFKYNYVQLIVIKTFANLNIDVNITKRLILKFVDNYNEN